MKHWEKGLMTMLGLSLLGGVAKLPAQRLEVRIAIPVDEFGNLRRGIYHEKLGLFSDRGGNAVAFTGSPNETAGGLIDNFETIDVFWTWDDPHQRVERKASNFDRMWENETRGLSGRLRRLSGVTDIIATYRATQLGT